MSFLYAWVRTECLPIAPTRVQRIARLLLFMLIPAVITVNTIASFVGISYGTSFPFNCTCELTTASYLCRARSSPRHHHFRKAARKFRYLDILYFPHPRSSCSFPSLVFLFCILPSHSSRPHPAQHRDNFQGRCCNVQGNWLDEWWYHSRRH